MHFDQATRIFESTFAADTTLSAKAVSEIYINKNFWYPHENYTITVTFADWPGFMADDASSAYVYGKSVKRLKNDNVIQIKITGVKNNNRWIKVRVEPEAKHDVYDLSQFDTGRIFPEDNTGAEYDKLFGPQLHDDDEETLFSTFGGDNQFLIAKSI